MPLFYRYDASGSFLARMWWQEDETTVESGHWDEKAPGILPIWVRFDGHDGQDTYMRAEPLDVQGNKGVSFDLFWFGLYEGRGFGGGYYYQIRPAARRVDAPPRIMKYAMDADYAGYMAMYVSASEAGKRTIIAASDLWRLEGLTPTRLKTENMRHNLKLTNFDGSPVGRYKQFGVPYLNSKGGRAGRVTLEVVTYPFP